MSIRHPDSQNPPWIELRRRGFLHPEALPWIVLVLILLLTFSAWYLAREAATHRVNDRFLYRAEKERDHILQRMAAHEQVLRGIGAFIESSEEVSRGEWHRYINQLELDKSLPGMQGLGFTLMISPAEKAAHEQKVRAEGLERYEIYPPGIRGQYSSIIYLEPHTERNQRALGFDMYTEPLRRDAMERARDSGLAALSGKLLLSQIQTDVDQPRGFLIYLPVYRSDQPRETVEQRRAALSGFVFSAFRAGDLLRTIVEGEDEGIGLALFDVAVAPENLLYDSLADKAQPGGRHVVELPVDLGGRRWIARFQSSPEFDSAATSHLPETIVGVGLLLGLMIFGLLYNNARHRNRIEAIALRLAESEQSLRGILDNTPDAVFIAGPDGRYEYVNQKASELVGYTAEELLAMDIGGLAPVGPDDTHLRIFEQIVEHGRCCIEIELRCKDDSIVPAEMSAVQLPNGSVLGLCRDITQRKQAEAELEQNRLHLEELVAARTADLSIAKEAAEAANRAKSSFLANMSHELRTPMNAIIGFAGILQRRYDDPVLRDKVGKISSAANHLLHLLNDILDISKIDAERLTLERVPFRFGAIFADVDSLVGDRLENQHLTLRWNIDERLSGLELLGDPLRLQQILLNLVTNAAKFTERGGIEVSARIEAESIDNIALRLTVEDTGIGITHDALQRIFDPFEQADASITRRHGGTGLGLTICKQLVQLMGGAIDVASVPGQGSRFGFSLRFDKAGAQSADSPAQTSSGADAEAVIRARYQQMHLLLVEDDLINQEVAQALLQDLLGLSVDLAADGAEALEKAGQARYDLILMDVQMPVMDGLAATRAIRQLPDYASTPILAMTANAFADDRQRCLAAGMSDFIAKPVDPDVLFLTLLKWFERLPASGHPLP